VLGGEYVYGRVWLGARVTLAAVPCPCGFVPYWGGVYDEVLDALGVELDRAIVLDRVVVETTFCTVDCTLVVAPFSAPLRSLVSLLRGEVLPRLVSGSASSTAIAATTPTTDAAVARFRPFDHPVMGLPLCCFSYPGRDDPTTVPGGR
jgi:hypothetical protein